MKNILNILGFNIGWWACVLGAANGFSYVGPAAMLVFLVLHFYINAFDYSEIKLIIIFAFLGTLIDTLMVYTGMLSYKGLYEEDIIIAPLWITAMWCGFAATVNHSMAFLKGKWIYSLISGAIFGPLAYMTGQGLGAINFNADHLSIIILLAVVWAFSLPLIFFVNDRLRLSYK